MGWRRGVVVSGVRRMNEVNARRVRLVLGWVTVFGRVYHSVRNQPTRSTQPCIAPGSLNRVPALAGVKAGMSPLPGGQVILCDPIWHVSSHSSEASCELLYSVYLYLYRGKKCLYLPLLLREYYIHCVPKNVHLFIFLTTLVKINRL